jgi:hypothetical protein
MIIKYRIFIAGSSKFDVKLCESPTLSRLTFDTKEECVEFLELHGLEGIRYIILEEFEIVKWKS